MAPRTSFPWMGVIRIQKRRGGRAGGGVNDNGETMLVNRTGRVAMSPISGDATTHVLKRRGWLFLFFLGSTPDDMPLDPRLGLSPVTIMRRIIFLPWIGVPGISSTLAVVAVPSRHSIPTGPERWLLVPFNPEMWKRGEGDSLFVGLDAATDGIHHVPGLRTGHPPRACAVGFCLLSPFHLECLVRRFCNFPARDIMRYRVISVGSRRRVSPSQITHGQRSISMTFGRSSIVEVLLLIDIHLER